MPTISILVEGTLDEAIASTLVTASGGTPGTTFPKKGVSYIEKKIDGFNELARGMPILSLVDLMDTDAGCPPELVRDWLPHRNEMMLFRVVVREIESWVLADRTGISRFLRVRKSKVPHHPETLDDPKEALIDLARSSPNQGLKNALVPDDPTQNAEGPAYTIRMENFVRNQWDLSRAQENASSLQRCVDRLEAFMNQISR